MTDPMPTPSATSPAGRAPARSPVPHTQVHDLVRRVLEHLQDIVIALLMLLLLGLSLQALKRLAVMAFIDQAAPSALLSEIVVVLILAEVYRLLIFYLREHRISVALTIEVALVSTLREVIIKGAGEFEWVRLFALSGLLFVLGVLLAMERWTRVRRREVSETDAH
ncbi:MAG: phosphate-starvation-inducible PsiE family protein [Candidatus Binatia bacterium]